MDVRLIFVKVKSRLNKADSSDYDNIQCWQFIEAFNKAQREWVRRQIHGSNIFKEGSEQTVRKVDDLQILLTTKPLKGSTQTSQAFTSENLPADYLEFVRVSGKAKRDKCIKDIYISLEEEANVSDLLTDWASQPSFEWAETFHTITDNKIKVYLQDFTIENLDIVYYRQPKNISIEGCEDINGIQAGNIDPEFKDDIVELLVDETVAILASDMESFNAHQIAEKRKENNN